MAFTREEIEAFIEALRTDAELRDRVRDAILDDDFRALPGIMRGLAERLDRLAERVEELAAADVALGRRIDALTERVDRLTERMDRLTERVDALAAQMERLVGLVERVDGRLGNVEGWQYEHSFRHNLAARLGPAYRRVREVALADEQPILTALDSGQLTEREYQSIIRLDAVAWARPRESHRDVLVAMELSIVIDTTDVRRAHDRAAILDRVFKEDVHAVVGGQTILPGAANLARELRVRVIATPSESAA